MRASNLKRRKSNENFCMEVLKDINVKVLLPACLAVFTVSFIISYVICKWRYDGMINNIIPKANLLIFVSYRWFECILWVGLELNRDKILNYFNKQEYKTKTQNISKFVLDNIYYIKIRRYGEMEKVRELVFKCIVVIVIALAPFTVWRSFEIRKEVVKQEIVQSIKVSPTPKSHYIVAKSN